jgi:hypothetical protein
MRTGRPLPARKFGKILRFKKSEVIDWFNDLEASAPVSQSTRAKLSRAMRRRRLDEAA